MNPVTKKYVAAILFAAGLFIAFSATQGWAMPMPTVQIGFEDSEGPEKVSSALQIMILLTVLTLAPSILIMTTAFSRIIIVLSFLRQAMGTQQTPPTQVLIGLALFLTMFVMSPVWMEINEKALQPFLEEQMSQTEAMEVAAAPLKRFMMAQTREKDLALFLQMSESSDQGKDVPAEITLQALIPAFIISELKTAFQIGFMIYIPFLILDMVVASILLSMGMMMLPPVLISLPFKLMLFVMVDGWYLTVGSLMQSFG
ncbi:MAG: flagellar type III secretion system pore protein FliP [Candidatus Nitrohelix vancouverensis]|uniref:Flagellar biosynthetic protein FliP n=1 Tax=Candidatus Nitrohelix vancouverensis TaxID=2705534 RepID=A0A7T0C2N8_9BACT|nr:MAG: flagellar type III secretion system pore protein FliP [Candidatus Nitrohelix vancouverensis]